MKTHSPSAGGAGLVALLLGLLAAPGCRQIVLAPDVHDRRVVIADGRSWGDDHHVVNSVALDGGRLTLEVSYAGGCASHAFTLVLSASFREADPVQLPAVLAHEANGDPCLAWLTETHAFDLALVRTRYRQFYGPGPGKVALHIEGTPDEQLVYAFDG